MERKAREEWEEEQRGVENGEGEVAGVGGEQGTHLSGCEHAV